MDDTTSITPKVFSFEKNRKEEEDDDDVISEIDEGLGLGRRGTLEIRVEEEAREKLRSELAARKRRAERFGAELVPPVLENKSLKKIYHNPKQSAVVGSVDLFSKEALKKKEERAKRFGLKIDEDAPEDGGPKGEDGDGIGGANIESLNEPTTLAMKVALANENKQRADTDPPVSDARAVDWPTEVTRLPEKIYVFGVDRMMTKDVFSFFQEYGPLTQEWIDGSSCVVSFLDDNAALRAMRSLARLLTEGELSSQFSCSSDSAGQKNDDDDPVNKEFPSTWYMCRQRGRGGYRIFLRLATVNDKKSSEGPPKSDWWEKQKTRRKQSRKQNKKRVPPGRHSFGEKEPLKKKKKMPTADGEEIGRVEESRPTQPVKISKPTI